MNHFPLNLITFGTCWPQELPVNYTELIKISVEILILSWNPSGDNIIALCSVCDMMLKYCKF